jgi:hypothetical protein
MTPRGVEQINRAVPDDTGITRDRDDDAERR